MRALAAALACIARQLAFAPRPAPTPGAREFADLADMARQLGFTRARVTQLMNLLLLAPEIRRSSSSSSCPRAPSV